MASKRGFASMNPEMRREICSKGGKAAHEKGKAHTFTHAEASAAGVKGGIAVREKYGPEYFQELGRRGGAARHKKDNNHGIESGGTAT